MAIYLPHNKSIAFTVITSDADFLKNVIVYNISSQVYTYFETVRLSAVLIKTLL